MGVPMLVGALTLAFGPPAALFAVFVWGNPPLLVLALGSAFAAWAGLLLTSFFWLAVPPLQGVHLWPLVVGPLAIEAVRSALLAGYMRLESSLDRITPPTHAKMLVDLPAALASGLAFGFMLSVMRYGAALATAGSVAAWYLPLCPSLSAYIVVAVGGLTTAALHTGLAVLMLDALRRRSVQKGCIAVGTHIAFSVVQALSATQGGCVVILPVEVLLAGLALAAAARAAAAPDYSARRQLRAWAAVRESYLERARPTLM
jgi:hypothetical protein